MLALSLSEIVGTHAVPKQVLTLSLSEIVGTHAVPNGPSWSEHINNIESA